MAPTSNRSARERAEELLDYVTEMRDDEGSLAVVANALAGIGYAVLALADVADPGPVDLGPLLNATRIHTDDDGRHFDDQGREYTAVEVDGEVTYRLIGGGQ